MARGINKVILIGNLGNDPDVRYTQNGSAVANLSLATSESWKDKNTGENQEKTEWHRVVCFARLGEIAGEYLKKGSKVYIEGRLQTRKWQDNSGQDKYTTEIVANDMQMLDSRGGGMGGGGGEYDQSRPSGPSGGGGGGQRNQSNQQNQGGGQQQPANKGAFDDFDDDIPF